MKPSKNNRQSGQTLLLALVVLIGLLLAALVLFDLHSTLRGKIKVETAQQAAALAGASWQVDGLNLLGQLNLVKAAATVTLENELAATSDPVKRTELRDAYNRRLENLTELQSRVSFIVPLLGVAAIQQTAKQNGMPNNNYAIERYASIFLPTHDNRADYINNYLWHAPYSRLLNSIVAEGCAMRINGSVAALPEVWSNSIGFSMPNGLNKLLLSERGLYSAIWSGNYCYWQLNKLAKGGSDIADTWLNNVQYNTPAFREESELLTLGIAFRTSGYFPGNYPNQLPQDLKNYCVYDSSWRSTDFNPESYEAHEANWKRGVWLRSDRKKAYLYQGAVTAVDNQLSMPRFNRIQVRHTPSTTQLKTDTLAWEEKKATTIKIGNSPVSDSSNYGVVAKPLGAFGNGMNDLDNPVSTDIVLPIFTQATIVPSSMPYNTSMLTVENDALKDFLIWLAQGGDIHNGNPPKGTERYREALLKLTDPNYLKSIYNPAFGSLDAQSPEVLFTDLYKFPNSPDGAGWLQCAWLGREMARPYILVDDPKAKQEYNEDGTPKPKPKIRQYLVNPNVVTQVTSPVQEPDGALRTYLGNDSSGYYYFLTKNGKILTNEDIACGSARWNGGSGNFPPGSNSGPSRL